MNADSVGNKFKIVLFSKENLELLNITKMVTLFY